MGIILIVEWPHLTIPRNSCKKISQKYLRDSVFGSNLEIGNTGAEKSRANFNVTIFLILKRIQFLGAMAKKRIYTLIRKNLSSH